MTKWESLISAVVTALVLTLLYWAHEGRRIRAVERELNNCLIFASTFDSSTGADIRDACIAVAYP